MAQTHATTTQLPPLVHGQRMSEAEFLAHTDETVRADWVDGEVTVHMPPHLRHVQLGYWLSALLGSFCEVLDAGDVYPAPVGLRLRSRPSYREPDLVFVSRHEQDRLGETWIDGPVSLVVEIISPDSVVRDQREKLAEYAAAGIPEYWLFDARPRRYQVVFYRLTNGRYVPIAPDADGRLHSAVLPGFWLDPAWLKQTPLPRPLTLLARIVPDAYRTYVLSALAGTEPDNGPAE